MLAASGSVVLNVPTVELAATFSLMFEAERAMSVGALLPPPSAKSLIASGRVGQLSLEIQEITGPTPYVQINLDG